MYKSEFYIYIIFNCIQHLANQSKAKNNVTKIYALYVNNSLVIYQISIILT